MLELHSSGTPLVVETPEIRAENLPTVLATLQGCWKSSSLLWLQANGFPVLPGLILRVWSEASHQAVIRFCRERNCSQLLLRVEKPRQRWTRQRGGYIVPLEQVPDAVASHAKEELIAILLEPASPYTDAYSLACVCDIALGSADVEVVGPGFDASDILRGDITPHERFEVSLGGEHAHLHHPRVKRTFLIDQEPYLATVQRRLIKIGAKLRNPSFPDEVMTSSSSQNLAEEAEDYLTSSGQTTLLKHRGAYEPIPPTLFEVFLHQASRLRRTFLSASLPWRTLSFACGFLPRERFIIWDLFSPETDDTRKLAELRPLQGHR